MKGNNDRRRFDPASIPAQPDLSFEFLLWTSGLKVIAGIDEAGRGALAGPVAAAAVVLPDSGSVQKRLAGVRDSKQMTPTQREYWAGQIRSTALAFGVGMASAAEIDDLGIVPATQRAAQRALDQLVALVDCLLLDCMFLPESELPQVSLVKGDQRSLSIASASVLAKTVRDSLMSDMDGQFPGYDLAVHKGYGTLRHRQAILRLGPSPIHRLSFAVKPEAAF